MNSRAISQSTSTVRNKGAGFQTGKIIKGTLNEAPVKLKVSSIPSKFQNVIYKVSSQPAFGDSTKKFYTAGAVDQAMKPGPSDYSVSANLSKIQNKKGSGFFASSTKLQRMERSKSHGPGPGAYQFQKKSIFYSKSKKTNSTLNTSGSTALLSSTIQSRDPFKFQLQHAKAVPGIGSYDLNPEKIVKSSSLYSTFKSKIQRFPIQSQKSPPVGIYEISQSAPDVNLSERTRKMDMAKQKQLTQSEKQKVIEKAIRNLSKKQFKDHLGPGFYEPQPNLVKKTFKIRQTMYDRFGQLKPIYQVAKNIEIDQNINRYEPEEPIKPTQTNKYNSMFKSETQRSSLLLKNIMDPGEYNAKSPEKKSHLINFARKWV